MVCELLIYGMVSGGPKKIDVHPPKERVVYRLPAHHLYVSSSAYGCNRWIESPPRGQFYILHPKQRNDK